jgi:hypothetical protein
MGTIRSQLQFLREEYASRHSVLYSKLLRLRPRSMGTSKAIARDKFEETPVQRLKVCTVFPSSVNAMPAIFFFLLHFHSTEHTGIVMTRNQTSDLELA